MTKLKSSVFFRKKLVTLSAASLGDTINATACPYLRHVTVTAGAVLGRQNTSSEQLTSQYGRQ